MTAMKALKSHRVVSLKVRQVKLLSREQLFFSDYHTWKNQRLYIAIDHIDQIEGFAAMYSICRSDYSLYMLAIV